MDTDTRFLKKWGHKHDRGHGKKINIDIYFIPMEI